MSDTHADAAEAVEAPEVEVDEQPDLTDDEFDAALDSIEKNPSATPESLKELRRIRSQVAKQRERGKDYAFFDTFHPEDRSYLLSMVNELQTNPQAATVKIAEVLQTVWGDQLPGVLRQLGLTAAEAAAVERKVEEAAPDTGDDEDAPDLSDPRALAQWFDGRMDERDRRHQQQAAAEQARQQQVDAAAADLAARLKKLGIDDPRSEAGWLVLSAARDRYDYDIEAAYKGLAKQGFRLPTATPADSAGAEASSRPAAPEGANGPPEAAGQNRPRTREDIMRDAERRAYERFDRQGVPAT